MTTTPQTATTPAPASASAGVEHSRGGLAQRRASLLAVRPRALHLGLVLVMAVSAVLNTHRLAQNGYANIFYSAGVKSMLRSLHNFLYVSFDPGGLITVDKPPLALWVQAVSAKLFGFSPLSLLLPEAIIGILCVAALYLILARRLGLVAALAGALALAVYPSFVAVSRANGVDPLLILLLVLACGAGLRASESGSLRMLLACGVLVGLAFNTKTLAAYLVVPSIALGYVVCAPGSLWRRLGQLAVAGAVMLVVSFAWIAFVELTPASKRPFVGSSTNNTELGLTFEYNGLGRVEGQVGGPSGVAVRPGAYVPAAHERAVDAAYARTQAHALHVKHPPGLPNTAGPLKPTLEPIVTKGREKVAIPFGGPTGPLRLFGVGLGDQAGWLLPFALLGALGLALLALLDRTRRVRPRRNAATSAQPSPQSPPASPQSLPQPAARPDGRRDQRLATALVLGGWLVVEALVLSLSKGIVHPYYTSALAPATAAMAGAGAVAFVKLARAGSGHRLLSLALIACALAATVAVQVVLLHREHYMLWFVPILVIGAAVGFLALAAIRRLAAPALALTFLLVLVAPGAYASTTWLAPVEATFPVAGPKHLPGPAAYGVNARDERIDLALANYVLTHRPGSRWALLTVASDTAAPMMLFGLDAGALGGYSGTDPALDGPGLARLVARGQARYVLLGGGYSLRGGNLATKAVLRACKELSPVQWHSPVNYPYGLVLFDCAGDQQGLAAAG